ncbi:hypothetical protein ACKKBG_A35325 [Auxenochlorella protothecoides x Auxenochlorella symbiontica]
MVRARLGDIQFFVYDARRGARESTELEKLLAVYPSVPDPTDLLWAVGLLQGLATFANTFGQASDWTRTETQRSVWLSVQAQPSISLGLALAKSAIPRHATEDGVQAILVLLRSLVATLHGGVQALLDEDPSGASAGARLTPLLMHLHSQLSSRSSALARELRNPFCAPRAVPAGPLPRAAARAAQSLDSALRCAAGVASAGSAVLDGQGRLLWTSLPEGCAEGLAAWAGAERPAPGPAALQPGARWEACEVDARGSGAEGPGPASVLLLRSAGEARLPKLHLGSPPRPFECLLLSMAPADLWVIVALDRSGGGCSKAQAAALHNLARPWLEPLIKEAALPPERPAHLPGYRYMAVREGLAGALASPRPKISAMSHVDRAMAAAGRDSMARQGALGAAADWTDADGGASRTSFREVLARAATGGSWLLMQESMQGHLLAVRQGAGEKTIKDIMPAVADLQRRLDLNA